MAEVLTPRQIAEVYERWDTGKYTQSQLADWFGCSQQLISKLMKEREEGRSRACKEDVSIAEDIAEEYIAVRAIETTLGLISKVMGDIWRKPDRTERDFKELSVAKGSMKSLLDARKQLKELPKDLKGTAAKVDDKSMERLVKLIPEDKQGEFLDIMRGLSKEKPKEG
jgi:hypothetical protein